MIVRDNNTIILVEVKLTSTNRTTAGWITGKDTAQPVLRRIFHQVMCPREVDSVDVIQHMDPSCHI